MMHTVFRYTMTTSSLVFIILSFVAISTRAAKTDGIVSAYCEKARLHSSWYPLTPVECCSDEAKCSEYILPGATKYGLTNPDLTWPRRHCSCDRKLYDCVVKGLSSSVRDFVKRDYAFEQETCFRRGRIRDDGTSQPEYEFMPVTAIVSRSKPKN